MIRLPIYSIVVDIHEGSGSIASDLHEGESEDVELSAALHTIESMILAHACAGVDITTPAYIDGIQTTVDAVLNEYG